MVDLGLFLIPWPCDEDKWSRATAAQQSAQVVSEKYILVVESH